MFIHHINPVLFNIGPMEIRYYGLAYVLGVLLVIFFLQLYRRQGKLNLSKDEVYDLVFWITLGMFIGARLFHVIFWNFDYYFVDPIEILKFWNGGMSFHGGLTGAALFGWFFLKKNKVSFAQIGDLIVIPAFLILGIGRICNFINAEIVGRITEVSWCFDFGDGLCRHPYQLYASAKNFLLAGVLALMNLRKHKQGFLFWMFILLYGISRFILDFWREDILYYSLSMGQWLCSIMIILGIYVLLRYYWNDLKNLFS